MSAEEPDDRALLLAHVAGDTAAFGILFGRHRDRLWAIALRTTGDREEAADALQDAMVAAFRRADSFRGDSAVTTWLHRIVVNSCLDRLRRRKVRRAEPLPDGLSEDLDPRTLAGSVSPSAAVVDPADLAVDHERRAAVLTALAALPPDQRAALVLVDMEGYSVQDAADILECAPGTVKSRCSRGRARLLPLLLEHRTGRVPDPTPPDAPLRDPGPGNPDPGEPGNPRSGPRVGPARRRAPAPPATPATTQGSTTEPGGD
jgi:RNA polymerase sigma-70 factor, ECF subfamily